MRRFLRGPFEWLLEALQRSLGLILDLWLSVSTALPRLFLETLRDLIGRKRRRWSARERRTARTEPAASTPTLHESVAEGRMEKRRPTFHFCYAVRNDRQFIEEERLLTKVEPLVPPPFPKTIELRFQLSKLESEIPLEEQVLFSGLKQAEYPLQIRIRVWSEDCVFDKFQHAIKVPESGNSAEAWFPLTLTEEAVRREKAVIFLFADWKDDLIAAFRIEARVSRRSEFQQAVASQAVKCIFLSTDWFHFGDSPVERDQHPALTLYFRVDGNHFQVFTLAAAERPWGDIRGDLAEFRQLSRKAYRGLMGRALLAGMLAEAGKSLSFFDPRAMSRDLADIGWQIFARLFVIRADGNVDNLSRKLQQLPVQSRLTIAIEGTEQVPPIPWGILYDTEVPSDDAISVRLERFWGMRFRLTVQPSYQQPLTGTVARPAKIGICYHNRDESREMESSLEPFVSNGLLAKPVKLTVSKSWIPGLLSERFDLLHFYCHGHTDLKDQEFSRELKMAFDRYRNSIRHVGPIPKRSEEEEFLMHLSSGFESQIVSEGGTAKYSIMWNKMRSSGGRTPLKGAPIVLLSMCESAQVSCAGDSFVTSFLEWGARSVVGTEGPNVWSVAREMDTRIIGSLLKGLPLRDAVWKARHELAPNNITALIYVAYGDGSATITTESTS